MTFYQTITAAVADIAAHGFDSQQRLRYWLKKIRESANKSLVSQKLLDRGLKALLHRIYRKHTTESAIKVVHPGIDTYTINNVRPALRAELDRRVMASANLIVLNREAAIQKTLQRFSGWASSVPAGGSDNTKKIETKDSVRKAMSQLPFEERRVAIDQGHKFVASLNDIVGKDAGAIAVRWRSNFREANYNYRPDHRERDNKIYLIRDCLAQQKGFVKPGAAGYYDEITQAAEEPFCRCYVTYIYAMSQLPADMLTNKGTDEVVRVKELLN